MEEQGKLIILLQQEKDLWLKDHEKLKNTHFLRQEEEQQLRVQIE